MTRTFIFSPLVLKGFTIWPSRSKWQTYTLKESPWPILRNLHVPLEPLFHFSYQWSTFRESCNVALEFYLGGPLRSEIFYILGWGAVFLYINVIFLYLSNGFSVLEAVFCLHWFIGGSAWICFIAILRYDGNLLSQAVPQ